MMAERVLRYPISSHLGHLRGLVHAHAHAGGLAGERLEDPPGDILHLNRDSARPGEEGERTGRAPVVEHVGDRLVDRQHLGIPGGSARAPDPSL
ncbi:hypothetical protein GCM10010176_103290 [Nonomuraea spiralis]|nr:hypothetical protein GCM10010176_103290 [Nonomuraea spiralis]